MMVLVNQYNVRGAVNTVPFRSLYDALLWAKEERKYHKCDVQIWDNGVVFDVKP